jgi:hypothetical protein
VNLIVLLGSTNLEFIESFQYKDLNRLYCHHPALLPNNAYFEILHHIYCGFHLLTLLSPFLLHILLTLERSRRMRNVTEWVFIYFNTFSKHDEM